MPRRRKNKTSAELMRLNAWKGQQETKTAGKQELEVRGQKPADEQEVEVRGQVPSNEQEVEVRGQEPANEQEIEVAGQDLDDKQELQVTGLEPADPKEVEVTGEWKDSEFTFNPFTQNDQLQLAGQLNLSVHRYLNMDQRNVPLEAPISPIRIIGDGNCFYRAISYLICGTQEYHDVLRQLTVEYMSTLSEDVYRPWLAFEHPEKTMDQYLSRDGRSIQNRHPADLEAWATQVEINAMSTLLGRRIFMYVFSKRQTRSMSRRHREETTEASEVACIKRKTVLNADDDDDRKRAKRDRERKRYQEDPTYAKAQRDGKRTRYSIDKQHAQEKRDRAREQALERYHTDDDYARQKREREQERALERYHTDDDYAQQKREREQERALERYHTDDDYAQQKREREQERALERYHTDDDYAKQKREREQERYHTDDDYAQQKREREQERALERYHTDDDYAQQKKGMCRLTERRSRI
ncbi:uncharacterized protein LOC144877593 isoform X2 [Branchiostoma floridae x Branchiostoma japonicum]